MGHYLVRKTCNGILHRYSSYYHIANLSNLAPAYVPDIVENDVQNKWKTRKPLSHKENEQIYSMLLPPPNITGNLHLGHALTITIQDVLARIKQMKSNEICWVPGFDHAGLATQAVVERTLLANSGLTRQQFGREHFLNEIWQWSNEKRQQITEQINTLGTIIDWNRQIFTLNEAHKQAVTNALFKLWDKDLIYRDELLVNWCCHLGSVLSDIEVTNMKISGPTLINLPGQQNPIKFGRMIHFAYPVLDKSDEVIVATTRPETMLGDVAVAVHPTDQRYFHLHNASLKHPFTNQILPVILDTDVDPNFGTGAVKITPAHDTLDNKIAKRHNLTLKQVINEHGDIISDCVEYNGMNRWMAREAIINDLAKKGLLRLIESHNMQIPICSRTGDVIELMLKPQWFIKCKEMAKKSMEMVNNGQLKFIPDKYNNVWYNWMENLNDWCISRQVWWGHKIPFYHCKTLNNENLWLYANNLEEAMNKAQNIFKTTENIIVKQDDDVLDTWFSSAILPFAVHGWPKQTIDFKKYYPLSIMVTGNDILFFWVARMVMLGLELTNQLPFNTVLLHGIICDNLGRKMSKSKGNVIDPMHIIYGSTNENLRNEIINYNKNGIINDEEVEVALNGLNEMYSDGIPKCGADALRFTLMSQQVKNTFINFNIKECNANKLFCNKLWQATRFTLNWSEKFTNKQLNFDDLSFLNNLPIMDRWILNKLSIMIDTVGKSLENFEFHLATSALRSFLYSDFCSVYLECSKPVLRSENNSNSEISYNILLYCLEMYIRLLSPFMPHVCDELYSKLPNKIDNSVAHCTLPRNIHFIDNKLNEEIQEMLNIVEAARRMKLETGQPNLKMSQIYILTNDKRKCEHFKEHIKVLCNCLNVNIIDKPEVMLDDCVKEVIDRNTEVYLQLAESCNIKKTFEPKKLKLKMKLDKLEKMRSDKGYEKVPVEIQDAHTEKILKLNNKLKQLDELEKRMKINPL